MLDFGHGDRFPLCNALQSPGLELQRVYWLDPVHRRFDTWFEVRNFVAEAVSPLLALEASI